MPIVPGTQFPEIIQHVSHLQEFRDLSVIGVKLGDVVLLEGSIQPGDMKGGLYVWDPSSRYADDGIFVIKPDALSDLNFGRWHAVYRDRSQADKHRINFQITYPSPQLAEKVLIYAIPEELLLYADFGETQFTPGTPPIGDYEFTIWKNNVKIGSLTIHQDNTWTGTTGGLAIRFNKGDRFEIRANGPEDTPVGFFAFTIIAEYIRIFAN